MFYNQLQHVAEQASTYRLFIKKLIWHWSTVTSKCQNQNSKHLIKKIVMIDSSWPDPAIITNWHYYHFFSLHVHCTTVHSIAACINYIVIIHMYLLKSCKKNCTLLKSCKKISTNQSSDDIFLQNGGMYDVLICGQHLMIGYYGRTTCFVF